MTDPVNHAELPGALLAALSSAPRKLFIGGRWTDSLSGETFATHDPATGREIARVALGAAADVDLAVAAARAALDGPWGKLKPYDRQLLLLRLADLVERDFAELATIEALDMGNPITRGLAGRQRVMAMIRFYAGLATAIHGQTIPNSIAGSVFAYTAKEPVGVVGAITPWNSPLSQAVWKIAPALAAGCTVVLKPAEQACLSPLRLAQLFEEAGFPAGVLNVVTGYGAAGAALASHHDVNKISFTGSTRTGQEIIRASAGNVKRLSLELGGKSPDIVFADADLDAAVAGAAGAVFTNSGQLCIAGSRLFVERSIHDEFVERVAALGRAMKMGSPLDPSTQLGPLANRAQLDRVLGFMASGMKEGANAITGGERASAGELADGCYVPPTVFRDVHDRMEIAREEIFGPVISAMPFDSEDEVVRRANDTPYGLGGGVWTRDVNRVQRISSALKTGTVWVNCYLPMDPAVPFGGYKMSGYGRESGVEHIEQFLNVKSVLIRTV
ncbi:MAG TPA: aldehyde dehydrogenase family protein [Ramlibacter sp.]|nr:aldehyde dehydrogenase family protein [Ramlibacter sp.]